MKKIFLLTSALFFFIVSCKEETKSAKEIDQDYTGKVTQQDLGNSDITKNWFSRKEDKNLDESSMKKIKKNINDFEVVMYIGTWCPDSERDVPRMLKILEETNYDMEHFEMYTLDQEKKSEDDVEKKHEDIVNVPTILFLKDGKEVNRVVEQPWDLLEEDVAKIVSGEEYKHLYED